MKRKKKYSEKEIKESRELLARFIEGIREMGFEQIDEGDGMVTFVRRKKVKE